MNRGSTQIERWAMAALARFASFTHTPPKTWALAISLRENLEAAGEHSSQDEKYFL